VKQIKLEETSVNVIHGKNGISKKGTTNKVDMKPQNQLNRVYTQNLNYSAIDGRYSRSLFNVFRETMAKTNSSSS
jgi:hypothetical protein